MLIRPEQTLRLRLSLDAAHLYLAGLAAGPSVPGQRPPGQAETLLQRPDGERGGHVLQRAAGLRAADLGEGLSDGHVPGGGEDPGALPRRRRGHRGVSLLYSSVWHPPVLSCSVKPTPASWRATWWDWQSTSAWASSASTRHQRWVCGVPRPSIKSGTNAPSVRQARNPWCTQDSLPPWICTVCILGVFLLNFSVQAADGSGCFPSQSATPTPPTAHVIGTKVQALPYCSEMLAPISWSICVPQGCDTCCQRIVYTKKCSNQNPYVLRSYAVFEMFFLYFYIYKLRAAIGRFQPVLKLIRNSRHRFVQGRSSLTLRSSLTHTGTWRTDCRVWRSRCGVREMLRSSEVWEERFFSANHQCMEDLKAVRRWGPFYCSNNIIQPLNCGWTVVKSGKSIIRILALLFGLG